MINSSRILRMISLALISTIFSGCASITGTTNQNISVQTRQPTGEEVVGVQCELANQKGKWFVTTPGSVGITRSNDDMQILCNKDNFLPGRKTITSDTKGSMYGNIIFGGGIGAIIDHKSGAAYEYPSSAEVIMTKAQAAEQANTSAGPLIDRTKVAGSSVSGKSTEEQLSELKLLFDQNQITLDEYVERQRKIINR